MKRCPVIIASLLALIHAQSDPNTRPLEVKLEGPKIRTTQLDQELLFSCVINRNLYFVIGNFVETVHKSVDGSEKVMSQAGRLDQAEPSYYSVTLTPIPEEYIKVEFQIKKVRDIDEGWLICRVRTPENVEVKDFGEDSAEIIVQRPLEKLSLKFDKFPEITKDVSDPTEVEPGDYSVTCTAEGSNPAPTVKLFFDDKEVAVNAPDTDRIEGQIVKYRTKIGGVVSLTIRNNKQIFECVAKPMFGDTLTVKLPIKIKVYNPEISCTETEAYLGQERPIVSCTVSYEDFDITKFQFEVEGRVYDGEGGRNGDLIEVSREQLSETKVKVQLILNEAKNEHFEKGFSLLVVHQDGHITKQSVRLVEVPGKPGKSRNAAFVTRTSLATIILFLALLLSA